MCLPAVPADGAWNRWPTLRRVLRESLLPTGESDVIIWGSGNGSADLGVAEQRACATCERERPFKVLLQYKYAHLYYLRWVTKKVYYLACDICHRGSELDARAVEGRLEKHPIPFMTRYGWAFLAAPVALLMLSSAVGALFTVLRGS